MKKDIPKGQFDIEKTVKRMKDLKHRLSTYLKDRLSTIATSPMPIIVDKKIVNLADKRPPEECNPETKTLGAILAINQLHKLLDLSDSIYNRLKTKIEEKGINSLSIN